MRFFDFVFWVFAVFFLVLCFSLEIFCVPSLLWLFEKLENHWNERNRLIWTINWTHASLKLLCFNENQFHQSLVCCSRFKTNIHFEFNFCLVLFLKKNLFSLTISLCLSCSCSFHQIYFEFRLFFFGLLEPKIFQFKFRFQIRSIKKVNQKCHTKLFSYFVLLSLDFSTNVFHKHNASIVLHTTYILFLNAIITE